MCFGAPDSAQRWRSAANRVESRRFLVVAWQKVPLECRQQKSLFYSLGSYLGRVTRSAGEYSVCSDELCAGMDGVFSPSFTKVYFTPIVIQSAFGERKVQ